MATPAPPDAAAAGAPPADGAAPAAAPAAPGIGARANSNLSQKEVRSRRFRESTTEKIPPSYKTNTAKEDLLLQHVSEFEQQFISVYGNRFLFLCPPNECLTPKFLPTTVHATHLDNRELYDYETCAAFIADHLNYEQLKPANRYPKIIPAPQTILNWQAGDSFDFANVLVSLLIGVGYDAYCMSGFAPRYITTKDETREDCPVRLKDLNDRHESVKSAGQIPLGVQKTYAGVEKPQPGAELAGAIPKKAPFNKSSYLDLLVERADVIKKAQQEQDLNSGSDEEDEPDPDSNDRIHCWVLIRKGARGITEDIFIEPTTARIYPVDASPYLRADLVWNNKNLWVSMQLVPVAELNLDLYDSRCFEKDEEGEPKTDVEEITGPPEQIQYLDIPASWSSRLNISRESWQARYYHGEKVQFFRKCKLEKFAQYSQVDGLVQRTTRYKDLKRIKPVHVEEIYHNRRDKLIRRQRWPLENRTVDSFTAGRPNALKEIEEIYGVKRTLHFYPESRLDGLEKSIEEIGYKVSEWFVDRDDRLLYHSVKLQQPAPGRKLPMLNIEGLGDLAVNKIALKYDNEGGQPFFAHNPNFQKMVFYIAEGKIRVDMHGSTIMKESHVYIKEDGQLRPIGSAADTLPASDLHSLINIEKNSKAGFQEVLNRLYNDYSSLKKEETAIKVHRKDVANEIVKEPVVDKSVYDLARERAAHVVDTAKAAKKAATTEEDDLLVKDGSDDSKPDFLARYLTDFGGKPLDAHQAEFVAKKCKNDFRKRLLDRAAIIQKRLEEEQESLKKKRMQMQRRGGENAERDERAFEQYQSNAMFRIQILEQRLARHEMHSVKKFVELENALAEDARLSAMWQKK